MLVRYLTSAAVQKQLAFAYGFLPSPIELYRDADLLAQQPFLGMLEAVFTAARPRPVTPQYVRRWARIARALADVERRFARRGAVGADGARALLDTLPDGRARLFLTRKARSRRGDGE
jgi:hypothetical protein